MEDKNYFIQCEGCGSQVVAADSLQKLFENFFRKAARHNVEGMNEKLCEGANPDLSLDDLRSTFSSQNYQVYKATEWKEKPVEWEKAGYGGLKE